MMGVQQLSPIYKIRIRFITKDLRLNKISNQSKILRMLLILMIL